MKNTVLTLRKQKESQDKITMLTCYDYSMAKLMDEAEINVLLIGIHWDRSCSATRIRCLSQWTI